MKYFKAFFSLFTAIFIAERIYSLKLLLDSMEQYAQYAPAQITYWIARTLFIGVLLFFLWKKYEPARQIFIFTQALSIVKNVWFYFMLSAPVTKEGEYGLVILGALVFTLPLLVSLFLKDVRGEFGKRKHQREVKPIKSEGLRAILASMLVLTIYMYFSPIIHHISFGRAPHDLLYFGAGIIGIMAMRYRQIWGKNLTITALILLAISRVSAIFRGDLSAIAFIAYSAVIITVLSLPAVTNSISLKTEDQKPENDLGE